MRRLSILSILRSVSLCATIFALFARLHEEAYFHVTGPILGAIIAALVYRRDRPALITGGAAGGLSQGIIAVIVLKRGYIFPDFGALTGMTLTLVERSRTVGLYLAPRCFSRGDLAEGADSLGALAGVFGLAGFCATASAPLPLAGLTGTGVLAVRAAPVVPA
jgi:hypothetical protein